MVDSNGRPLSNFFNDGFSRGLVGMPTVVAQGAATLAEAQTINTDFLYYGNPNRAINLVAKDGTRNSIWTQGSYLGVDLIETSSIGFEVEMRVGHNTHAKSAENMVALRTGGSL